jgi:GTP-dependent phosphoenolpyruvate carboxykinase
MIPIKITTKGRGTDMLKMYTVVRVFLENYFKAAKNNRFYRPQFADNALELWYGLSEVERNQVLNMARRDNLVGLEDLIRKIDEDDLKKESEENEEEQR